MKHYNNIFKIIASLLVTLFFFTSCTSSRNISNNIKLDNRNYLKVNYIDVGQGDSILVQVNGKNLLIDAGTTESTDKLISYLDKQKITNLDYVVATHPHEDHIGGMSAVIKKYKIGEFYAPKITSKTKTFENMVKALKNKNIKINVAKPDITLDLGKNTKCEMLAPNSSKYEDLNNYSAVIKITYGNSKFLFMGDAEKLSENEILNKNYDISCDVLKVGHHGSNSSTSKQFLDKASPKIAVISCGKNNDYGHPHHETLDALKKKNIQIYRTDVNGSIVLLSYGSKITKQ